MSDMEWSYHTLLRSHIASRSGVKLGHADYNRNKPLVFVAEAGASMVSSELRQIADSLDALHDLARKNGMHDE